MISLMPRSNGFSSVLKRRGSKSYDVGRRDSFSINSSCSLPSSPDSMRRYSSYEELGPLVQQMLGPGTGTLQPPESRLKSRRSSITRLIRRNSVSREVDEHKRSCDALDLQLAKVREQLAQMKSQDLDMTQRVEDLSNSVQELWCKQCPAGTPLPQSFSSRNLRVIKESQLETDIVGEISEDDSESGEDDLSFEEYCRNTIPLIGDRRASNTTTSTVAVLPSVEIFVGSAEDEGCKPECILSRTSSCTIDQKNNFPSVMEEVEPSVKSNKHKMRTVLSEPSVFSAPVFSHTLTPPH